MKIAFVFLILVLPVPLAYSAPSENKRPVCSQHSDCDVGCVDARNYVDCNLKSQIQVKATWDGTGACRSGPGGLLCGCDQGRCTYMHPSKYNEIDSLKKAGEKPSDCAGEGQGWSFASDGKKCCPGLVRTSAYRHTNSRASCDATVEGDTGFCVKCGDGKCDSEHYESKCECAIDCK